MATKQSRKSSLRDTETQAKHDQREGKPPTKQKCTYSSYLQVQQLLSCLMPNTDVHDEHLFIVIHQVFELWFSQVLHDLSSILPLLESNGKQTWTSLQYHKVKNRLNRVVMILRLVVEQFHILETMPPLNFVDFRDNLTGGSGFQSLQFRKIEKLLGITDDQRVTYNGKSYTEKIEPRDKDELDGYPQQEEETLLRVVDRWLASAPGVDDEDFWEKYRRNEKVSGLESILDTDAYEKTTGNGKRWLSQSALKGALLINLHQDESIFQQPYELLTLLLDIDAALMKWRSTHIHMVHRMIGEKQGTGGEEGQTGYQYLRSTYSDNYKVFRDVFDLATYLRPRQEIPENKTLNSYLR